MYTHPSRTHTLQAVCCRAAAPNRHRAVRAGPSRQGCSIAPRFGAQTRAGCAAPACAALLGTGHPRTTTGTAARRAGSARSQNRSGCGDVALSGGQGPADGGPGGRSRCWERARRRRGRARGHSLGDLGVEVADPEAVPVLQGALGQDGGVLQRQRLAARLHGSAEDTGESGAGGGRGAGVGPGPHSP